MFGDKFNLDTLTEAFHNGSDLFAVGTWGGHGAYFHSVHRELDKAQASAKILEDAAARGWRVVRISMTPLERECEHVWGAHRSYTPGEPDESFVVCNKCGAEPKTESL